MHIAHQLGSKDPSEGDSKEIYNNVETAAEISLESPSEQFGWRDDKSMKWLEVNAKSLEAETSIINNDSEVSCSLKI